LQLQLPADHFGKLSGWNAFFLDRVIASASLPFSQRQPEGARGI
jgi:hypothetical protein